MTTLPEIPLPEAPRRARRVGRRGWIAVAVVAVLGLAIGLLIAQPWQPPPLLAPRDVAAGGPTATSLQVSWQVAPGSLTPDGFLVLRDGKQVGQTAGTARSYVDHGLIPGVSYAYTIVATAGAQRSKTSQGAGATTTAPAPAGVSQTGRDYTSVTLGWSAPLAAPTPDAFIIYGPSGQPIATVSGRVHSYTVTHLAPGASAQYNVAAEWSRNSSPVTQGVTATTRPAPLDHNYSVAYKTIAVPGGGASLHVGQTWSDQWAFFPTCSGSTCPTMKAEFDFDPPNYVQSQIVMTLRLSGGSYVGTTMTQVTTCGGTASTSLLQPSLDPPTEVNNTVSVVITPGNATTGAWTGWRAAMQIFSPYTVHHSTGIVPIGGGTEACPAQSWSFTATGHSVS